MQWFKRTLYEFVWLAAAWQVPPLCVRKTRVKRAGFSINPAANGDGLVVAHGCGLIPALSGKACTRPAA